MKKILLGAIFLVSAIAATARVVIPYSEIPYNVNYRLGFIDVNIARGTATIESDGTTFSGTINGTSIPWRGKIMCVSDTLRASVVHQGDNVTENVIYQSGWYRHTPEETYNCPDYNPNDPAFFKNIAGLGDYDASRNTMEAITVTADMIGIYYLAHALNFADMQPGDQYSFPINGPYSKRLDITYNGPGSYTTGNGETIATYDCTFEYAYDGAMSGYPVECKISTDGRVPVFMSADLIAGHVELLYAP
ncbi:MAG: hypothetical protein J1E63_02185 [Muribaculaceae bacterium]|nr:hypothetical protein [Muribaculaceae bacterium]